MNEENKPVIDYFEGIEDPAPEEQPATLERLSQLAERSKELEELISAANVALAELQGENNRILMSEIPGVMLTLGMESYTLTDGSKIAVKEDVKASITVEHKPAAHAWLKENDFGGILKTKVLLEFGKGEEANVERVSKALQEIGFPPSIDEGVHAQTLKAFVKEQLEAGTNIPMDLFGVYEFRQAKITLPKKKK